MADVSIHPCFPQELKKTLQNFPPAQTRLTTNQKTLQTRWSPPSFGPRTTLFPADDRKNALEKLLSVRFMAATSAISLTTRRRPYGSNGGVTRTAFTGQRAVATGRFASGIIAASPRKTAVPLGNT